MNIAALDDIAGFSYRCLIKYIVAIIIAGDCLAVLAASKLSGEKILRVAIYTYPPLLYRQGDDWGYCLEIVKAIFEPKGYAVQPEFLPVARAIIETENLNQDAICAINPFNSKNLSLASYAVAKLTYSFWVRETSNFSYTGIESLQDQQLITIIGYNYTLPDKAYQEFLSHPDNQRQVTKLSGSEPIKRGFKMIAQHRADSICLDEHSANFTLQENDMAHLFKKAGSLPNTLYAYFGVSQDHPEKQLLLAIYNKGFLELYETGVIRTILAKYEVSSWPLQEGLRPSG